MNRALRRRLGVVALGLPHRGMWRAQDGLMRAMSLVTILIPWACSLLAPSSTLARSTPLTATELHVVQLDERGGLASFVRIDAPADYEWVPLATMETEAPTAAPSHDSVGAGGMSRLGTSSGMSGGDASPPMTEWDDLEDQPLAQVVGASAMTTHSSEARLTLVPEPSLLALVVLGGAALLSARRHPRWR